MSIVAPKRAGWGLWASWVWLWVAFMAGAVFATDFVARPALTQAIGSPAVREALIVLGLGVIMAVMGAAHWLILRPYVAQAGRWGAALAVTLGSGEV